MNMKNIIIYIAFASVLFLSSTTAVAQITVGSDQEPEDFSMLQVEAAPADKRTGIRMPQLDNAAKAALEAKITVSQAQKDKAKGLMIFNSDTKGLEYWNGTKWITIPNIVSTSSLTGENGIAVSGTNVSLNTNGLLTEASTGIDLNDSQLSFPATTGKFIVQANSGAENTLTVTGGKVGVGTDAPTADLHIKSSSVGGAFKMSEKGVLPGELDVLYAQDNLGTAYWRQIDRFSIIESVTIPSGINVPYATAEPYPAISSQINLTSGKWLVMATMPVTSSNNGGRGTWLVLYKFDQDGNNRQTVSAYMGTHSGTVPYTAFPQITVPVIVPNGQTIRLAIHGLTDFTAANTVTTLAGGRLVAVKLDD